MGFNFLRLFIVIPIYGAIAFFLPKQPGFLEAMSPIFAIHPDRAMQITVLAMVAAALGAWMLSRSQSDHTLLARHILMMGCVGILASGMFEIFKHFSGETNSLFWPVLITAGFLIAETVYVLMLWGWRSIRREN